MSVVEKSNPGPEAAELIAERVREAIGSRPVDVVDTWLNVTASVGVAVADPSVHDPDELLRMADLAMYEVKDRSRTRVQGTADPAASAAAVGAAPVDLSPLAIGLARAIEGNELVLYQQPLVGRDGSLRGVEMLIRWPHPEHGLLGARRVVAAATDGGLASDLGRWVRRLALEQRRGWARVGSTSPVPPVHINIGRAELHSPGFADEVEADIASAGASAGDLILEVHEADLAGGDPSAVLEELRARGTQVFIDCAGEGGLSLVAMVDLPLSGLKVGPGLVSRLDPPAGGHEGVGIEIVRSLVLLAHGLGWRSLAVGVETDRQRSVLFGFGVDAVQGRAVAMPVPSEAFGSWLDAEGHRA